ncbi:MAG TPA: hypothetical protein VJ984_10030 [Xanthomonadales bacterium]|nr:hypothetical protein [Xanthomonadales bacterium]
MKLTFFTRLQQTGLIRLTAILVCFALTPISTMAQSGFASLEEQMTGTQFQAAGLEKLTPEELASLNTWIRMHSLATLDAPRVNDTGAMGSEVGNENPGIDEMEREPIVTRINGTFVGWDGHTIFKLENGMIWAQADKDKFYSRELINPRVVVEPAMFGTWKLSVEGFDEDVRVERLE